MGKTDAAPLILFTVVGIIYVLMVAWQFASYIVWKVDQEDEL